MALLDDPAPLPDTLPPLGHWLLGRPMARQSDIGADGHPARRGGTLLPPLRLPRRMWAASEVDFLASIPLDAAVERRTTVAAITPKRGRSGAMVFVTLDHEWLYRGAAVIRERQHLVYREPAGAAAPARPDPDAPVAETTRVVVADPVALFRYSALTFNGHRIHYDRDYAAFEGYPGLVVQGPFAATLLLDHARRHHAGASVSRFAFRARAPLFTDQPFTLAMAGDRLWIVDADGATAMTAEIAWG